MSIFFALLCGLSYAINNIWTNQVPAELSGKLVFYRSFLVFLINLVLTFLLWKLIPDVFPVNFDTVAILQNIGLASFLFIGLIFLFKALEKGPVSIVGSITGSTGIVSALLASFIYSESLGFVRIGGILLGVLCLFLISLDFKNLKSIFNQKNGVGHGLICFVFFGIGFTFTKPLIIALGPIFFSVIVELTNSVLALLYLYFSKQNVFERSGKINFEAPFSVYKKHLRYLIISSMLIVIAGLSQSFALTFGSISVIEPIIRTSLAFSTIGLSLFFLKEKLSNIEIVSLIGLVASLILIGL